MTLTPNGYADAITNGHFVLPEEKIVPMEEFLNLLENPVEHRVPYIQKQNSNLTDEFPELLEDSGTEIKWASEVFGNQPDAVNFWMGDERAVTSSKLTLYYYNLFIAFDLLLKIFIIFLLQCTKIHMKISTVLYLAKRNLFFTLQQICLGYLMHNILGPISKV